MKRMFISTIVCLTIITGLHGAEAQVRSSSNYQIQSDSVNFAGGRSTSTNYVQESTAGEVGTGESTSSSYVLRAGYQQMQEVFLSLAGGADVTMSPNIPGITGGESNGSTTVTALTDSPSGYQLTIEASASPAMVSGANTIADYVPVGVVPDLLFTTAGADAHFAFSPFGSDVVTRFQTDGLDCGVSGSASTTACWDGLSTTAAVIASSISANQPTGSDTTIYYRVGVGGSANQAPGDYVATTTLTLLSL